MSALGWEDPLDPDEDARRARAREVYEKMYPRNKDDPYGAKRLKNCRAQTPAGIQRACNRIISELVGETDSQGSEQSKERLEPREIDRNAYCRPEVRQLPPYETRSRRKPGWIDCRFVLPRPIVEGLSLLARSVADRENAERAREPRGQRRRYPKSKNFYVTLALNSLLQEYGLSQFCVEEVEVSPGHTRRFVVRGS
jgi:hypothetical protein